MSGEKSLNMTHPRLADGISIFLVPHLLLNEVRLVKHSQ